MEIERKWLVEKDQIPYDLTSLPHLELEQVYISFVPSIRVRSMQDVSGAMQYVLTVKGGAKDAQRLSREEFEMPIEAASYIALCRKAEGSPIRKTRYYVHRADGLTEEIDVFHGSLEGLAYLEIEFESVQQAQAFPSPAWTKWDVTADRRYQNSALARFGAPEQSEG